MQISLERYVKIDLCRVCIAEMEIEKDIHIEEIRYLDRQHSQRILFYSEYEFMRLAVVDAEDWSILIREKPDILHYQKINDWGFGQFIKVLQKIIHKAGIDTRQNVYLRTCDIENTDIHVPRIVMFTHGACPKNWIPIRLTL